MYCAIWALLESGPAGLQCHPWWQQMFASHPGCTSVPLPGPYGIDTIWSQQSGSTLGWYFMILQYVHISLHIEFHISLCIMYVYIYIYILYIVLYIYMCDWYCYVYVYIYICKNVCACINVDKIQILPSSERTRFCRESKVWQFLVYWSVLELFGRKGEGILKWLESGIVLTWC
jgi:hypothetical protein